MLAYGVLFVLNVVSKDAATLGAKKLVDTSAVTKAQAIAKIVSSKINENTMKHKATKEDDVSCDCSTFTPGATSTLGQPCCVDGHGPSGYSDGSICGLPAGGKGLFCLGTCAKEKCPQPADKKECSSDGDCPSGKKCKVYASGDVTSACIAKGDDPSNGGSCFDKDSTSACFLTTPSSECQHVLMADLVPGDLVLGRDGATSVVAVQHKAVDTISPMLTFDLADGSSVTMTPDHALFVDGALVAAADAKVGSSVSTGVITRITKGEGAIINPVTADGTIVADGVLAASNPYWIAALTVDAPLARSVANAIIYAVGDADSLAAGFAKIASSVAGAAFVAMKALRSRKSSA
jgi:hypothetical protein